MPDETRETVARLLQESQVKTPPVPVERLAKKEGILLCPLPGSDEISGALIRKQGRAIIAVNPAHHENRQRFTIAHELGHYFLHERLEEHIDEGSFRVSWR